VSQSVLGIRFLFAATVIVFALETMMAIRGSEPYPALMLPPFTGTPLRGDIVSLKTPGVVVQFADGSSEAVPYQRLLPDSPMPAVAIFFAATGNPKRPPNAETMNWLRERINALFPDKKPKSADISWRITEFDITGRPARHTPEKTIRVDF
jgi:hypothetical protein